MFKLFGSDFALYVLIQLSLYNKRNNRTKEWRVQVIKNHCNSGYMRLTLILTGKTREKYLKEGVDEYVKRIKHYAPFEVKTINDIKVSRKTGAANVKKLEGQQILQLVKPGDHLVLLDEAGKMLSSPGFSEYLMSLEGKTGHTVFVVGGAFGFSDEVYERADAKLSLSLMTFSHQMVRLIFTEQLYRAYTIRKGEPYHHN